MNTTHTIPKARLAIAKVKTELIEKWNKIGGYEDFGDKEGSLLRSKFNFNPYGSADERHIAGMIQEFENWAMDYVAQGETN